MGRSHALEVYRQTGCVLHTVNVALHSTGGCCISSVQNLEKGAITVNSENRAFHSLGCNCAILSLLYTQNSINSSANFKKRYYCNCQPLFSGLRIFFKVYIFFFKVAVRNCYFRNFAIIKLRISQNCPMRC